MYQSSVPSATAGTARTALALVAIFSLLLSLFAIARPVIANHDDGIPEVPGYSDTSRENQGGNIEACLNEDATFVDFPSVENTDDSGSDSGSIDGDPYSLEWTVDSEGELTFIVTGALVEEVFVKGGSATTIYDYSGGPNSGTFPGPGIAHDDGLVATEGGISNLGFCLIPIPEGSIEVLKVGETQNALSGAEFSVEGREGLFTTGEDGTFCVDGFDLGTMVDVTEVNPPAGYNDADPATQTATVEVEGTCEERGEAGPDLTFANTLIEEDRGSITVVKEIDCDECETRTIGYYFNTADQHDEETNALFGAGIEADGILFTNVDQVQQYRADDQDGTSDGQNGLSARGQLTLQFLAASLNVERNGDDCELATRVYNNSDSPFDGWTVQMILDEAELAFDETSAFSDEEIKDALDDINNSSQSDDNPLTCEGSESGTLDGVTFDLFTQADFESDPQGDPIDSQTTENGGVAFFGDLELEVTYVLVESGFPEGVTCLIVGVEGGDAEVVDGVVYVTLTAESLDANLNLTITVENDCEEEQEEEVGSLLIAKANEAGESLGGATFTVDGIEHADTDEDGFVCVDGLTLGDTVSVEETVAPEGFIGEEGAVDVAVLSPEDCATRLAGEDPQADADITFVNVAEEEEDDGILEIIKFFCPTAGDDSILVIGPAPEEPIESSRVQGEDEEELPEPGCTLGEAADGATAEFTITGGPEGFEPITVETEKNQIIELDLEPGNYTITETSTGLTANFTILAENDTAVLVINRPEVLEEDQGNIKIIKLFCEGAEDDVVFTIVEGENASLGDALVETPDEAFNCEVGDATFTLNDGETDSAAFTVGSDGIRLIPINVGTYSLTETLPNQATSSEFEVTEGETTTVIVFNLEEESDEEGGGTNPDTAETPRDAVAGGNPLPDTATLPIPGGSVPAALLALAMLSGLGAAGYAMATEARRRR